MKQLLLWLLALSFGLFISTARAEDVQLGAGDVLKISVYGNPDLTLETRISENGSITFPLIGDVAIAGMSTSTAEKKISGLLATGGFLRKAQVNIIVTVLTSQQVSVLGQVNRPGRYPIEGKRTLTDLIALAGGANADGGDTVTVIRNRNGKSARDVIDLLDMVRSGDIEQNIELAAGDLMYVERAPRFYIYGEVQRPGQFRLERHMTVLQALSVGGGLTLRGTERNIRIKRRDAAGVVQIITAKHDDVVQVDDVVFVQESLF